MTILAAILAALSVLPPGLVAAGWWIERRPRSRCPSARAQRWVLGGQLVVFGALFLGIVAGTVRVAHAQRARSVAASPEEASRPREVSTGAGLALLGAAVATGLSVVGAGYAVGVIGAAALGAITEKPELFGRTFIFVGLAEGLAIYGLIMSILILARL
jgi:V/A-type H+-transporting ATPase subunit K